MEFNEKLQALRKAKGLTQEELAAALYVSRTAVSKWESGRGYPGIDSLKAIAKFFSVTVDELLSGEEALTIAEADSEQKQRRFCDLVFGLLDCSVAMFFFLPFFGQSKGGLLQEVSLLSLTEISPFLLTAYYAVVVGILLCGIAMLLCQLWHPPFFGRWMSRISLGFNVLGLLFFINSRQPYAASFLLIFGLIKLLLSAKRK